MMMTSNNGDLTSLYGFYCNQLYFSNVPLKTEERGKHYESICLNELDGKVYLASSGTKNNEWEGFVSSFISFDDFKNQISSCDVNYKIGPLSHIVCGKSGEQNLVIASFDCGALLIMDSEFNIHHSFHHNDNYFTDTNINTSYEMLAATNNDKSILIVRLDTIELTRKFDFAHFLKPTGIDFRKDSNNHFVSCGKDGQILFWDLRVCDVIAKYSNLNSPGTSLKWSSNENNFLIGTHGGDLILFDARKFSRDISSTNHCSKPIRRLRRLSKGIMAAISESFIIFDEASLMRKYKDDDFLSEYQIQDCIKIDTKIYTINYSGHQIKEHFLSNTS